MAESEKSNDDDGENSELAKAYRLLKEQSERHPAQFWYDFWSGLLDNPTESELADCWRRAEELAVADRRFQQVNARRLEVSARQLTADTPVIVGPDDENLDIPLDELTDVATPLHYFCQAVAAYKELEQNGTRLSLRQVWLKLRKNDGISYDRLRRYIQIELLNYFGVKLFNNVDDEATRGMPLRLTDEGVNIYESARKKYG
jgi:hypothetical protein